MAKYKIASYTSSLPWSEMSLGMRLGMSLGMRLGMRLSTKYGRAMVKHGIVLAKL